MQVTATAKFVRLSPRKARLLLETVKGLRAEEAVAQLKYRPHAAAVPVAKLITSAAANAAHNYSLDPSTLVVDQLTADAGPTLKRYKPVSRGRAQNIRRKTTHLTVVLRDAAPANSTPAKSTTAATGTRSNRRTTTTKSASDRVSAEPKPKVSSKAGDVRAAKHAPKSDSRAEVKQVAPRKSARQTGRGGNK